jgi:hypothetical protein
MDTEEKFNREDRDLLIELRTEMRAVRVDIKDLKDNTTNRIDTLEQEKADREEVEELQHKVNNDIEKRVAKLEIQASRYLTMMSIYITGVSLLTALVLYHIFYQ